MTAAAFVLLFWCAPARAQVGFGTGVGPDAFLYEPQAKKDNGPILPMALATSLAFDATTWAAVQGSTNPARELSSLVQRGYGKLEMIQSVLVARKAGATLQDVVAAHDKGKTLREVAQARKLDFDAVYAESLGIDERVSDELLPSILSVRGAPAKRPEDRPRGEATP